jgi:hypothetical protein
LAFHVSTFALFTGIIATKKSGAGFPYVIVYFVFNVLILFEIVDYLKLFFSLNKVESKKFHTVGIIPKIKLQYRRKRHN